MLWRSKEKISSCYVTAPCANGTGGAGYAVIDQSGQQKDAYFGDDEIGAKIFCMSLNGPPLCNPGYLYAGKILEVGGNYAPDGGALEMVLQKVLCCRE